MKCPLCAAEVPTVAELDAHIREELDYARWRCRYCVVSFFSYAQALTHFDPVVRTHPGKAPSIAESVQIDLEKRVQDLMGQDKKVPPEVLIKPDPYALVRPPLVFSTPLEEPLAVELPATDPQEALLREKMDLEEEEEEEPEMVSLGAMGSVKSRPDEMEEEEEEELVTPSPNSSRASLVEEAEEATSPNAELNRTSIGDTTDVADQTEAGTTEEKDVKPLVEGGEKCHLCGAVVSSLRRSRALRNHVVAVHMSRFLYKCGICDKGFKGIDRIDPTKKNHFRKSHPGQPIQLIDFRSELAAEMKRRIQVAFPAYKSAVPDHSLSAQKGSDNDETIEERIFVGKTKRALAKVEEDDKKPAARLCQLCSKPVLDKYGAKRLHMTVHHLDGGAFACELCGRSFARLGQKDGVIVSHFRVHHRGGPVRVRDLRPAEDARAYLLAKAFPAEVQTEPTHGSGTARGASEQTAAVASKSLSVCPETHAAKQPKDEAFTAEVKRPASGRAKEASSSPCSKCGAMIVATSTKRLRHATFRHNDQSLYRCRLCEAGKKDAAEMRTHLTRAHPESPEESFDSRREELLPKLHAIVAECFP